MDNLATVNCWTTAKYRDYNCDLGSIQDAINEYIKQDCKITSNLCWTKPRPRVKRAIFNPPATVILWDDGTKSVVKCQNGEPFDAEKGFVMAYLKKLLGNDNTFNKEITRWVDYEEPVDKECVDKHCDTNEPLTTEELMKMDGMRVWLSSIEGGIENFTNHYCGWHIVDVSEEKLVECGSKEYYRFSSNGTPNGFRAYRKPPEQAEEN